MTARRSVAALIGLTLAGCGGASHSSSSTTSQASGSSSSPAPVSRPAQSLALGSPAFRPGGAIPRQYTCDGQDSSPPLRWTGVPRGTRELVLLMRDPDAPGGAFIHWALAGIAPATRGTSAGKAPPSAVEGRNGFGALGYRGPCPPPGAGTHHYVLTLSALARPVKLKAGFMSSALAVPAIASATLVGTYGRR
jgi:Raf kinase inhibitor-like YbhB/YbcL family protein